MLLRFIELLLRLFSQQLSLRLLLLVCFVFLLEVRLESENLYNKCVQPLVALASMMCLKLVLSLLLALSSRFYQCCIYWINPWITQGLCLVLLLFFVIPRRWIYCSAYPLLYKLRGLLVAHASRDNLCLNIARHSRRISKTWKFQMKL